jgi:hypothetical protein
MIEGDVCGSLSNPCDIMRKTHSCIPIFGAVLTAFTTTSILP